MGNQSTQNRVEYEVEQEAWWLAQDSDLAWQEYCEELLCQRTDISRKIGVMLDLEVL